MSGGRLTRQELGWLLAQEARGAAQLLRAEVTELRTSDADAEEERASALPGELTLNALDNAIDGLSQLQATPRIRKRGRIDLAALLYELAPNWQVSLEPGQGTEVHGDQEEYRRMLQMLLTQAGIGAMSDAMAVDVRREKDWVRVKTPLGPDAAATGELERRWLARMAVRVGGRYELHGSSQSLVVPAENDDKQELEALREELHHAQQQGRAYARELATVLEHAKSHITLREQTKRGGRFDTLRATACALLDDQASAMAMLKDLAAVPVDAPPTVFRFDDCARSVLLRLERVAGNRKLEQSPSDGTSMCLPEQAFTSLLDWLVAHAIERSPQRGRVVLGAVVTPELATIEIAHDGDPIAAGRSAALQGAGGLKLLAANALAEALGGTLSLDAGEGRAVLRLSFDPAPSPPA